MRGLWLAAACWVTLSAPAQSPDWIGLLEERFDETIPALLEEGHIPGAVILVGHRENGDWFHWSKAYGQMEIEPEAVPMPEDAIFDLASMTKPIATGTSLMILVDRGLMSVDDPVSLYLPEYDTEEKGEVTICDLMTHCSGLQAYIGADERAPIVEENGAPCPEALRSHIREISLRHAPPRSVSVYSCLNAITTAMVVEAVSGQSLDEFAAETIFEPLGMEDTAFSPGPGPRVVPTTRGDSGSGEFLRGMVHDPLANLQAGVSGNAGLFSTAQDLAIFAQMMLQGGEWNGIRILSEESVERMTHVAQEGLRTPRGTPVHRGLLWQVYLPRPGDVGLETVEGYGHTGYTGTAIRLYPEHDLYILAMTNRVHPDDSGEVAGFRHHCWVSVGDVVLGIDESVMTLKDATPLMRHFGG